MKKIHPDTMKYPRINKIGERLSFETFDASQLVKDNDPVPNQLKKFTQILYLRSRCTLRVSYEKKTQPKKKMNTSLRIKWFHWMLWYKYFNRSHSWLQLKDFFFKLQFLWYMNEMSNNKNVRLNNIDKVFVKCCKLKL